MTYVLINFIVNQRLCAYVCLCVCIQLMSYLCAISNLHIITDQLLYYQLYYLTYIFHYRISSINTASLICIPVWYYSNTNNIDMVVIFISSQHTLEQYRMPLCDSGYYSKISCNDGSFIDRIRVTTSDCKEKGCSYPIMLNRQLGKNHTQVYQKIISHSQTVSHRSVEHRLQCIISVMNARD